MGRFSLLHPVTLLPKCSLLCLDNLFQQSRRWEEELWGICIQQPPALSFYKKGVDVVRE